MNKLALVFFILLVWQFGPISAQSVVKDSCETIELTSSNTQLNEAFLWAKKTACSYIRDNDLVGKWYEAALPDRESFCMRDVSHMSTGAYFLGLKDYNKNMLSKFAKYISASRDWCSYWEISKDERPTPIDYTSDEDFWYNLPANFDVMNTCHNMYNLTGDSDYLLKEPFFSFHYHSVNEYSKVWDSDHDGILDSSPTKSVVRRGIASYEESFPGIFTGSDLLAAQAKGYTVFAEIMKLQDKEDSAKKYFRLAEKLEKEYKQNWWDAKDNSFFGYRMDNGKYSKKHNEIFVLLYDLIKEKNKVYTILSNFEKSREDGKGKEAVEGNSYLPLIFYKYNQLEAAYRRMLFMTDQSVERRTYPEVSYVFVGTVLEGLMGVHLIAPENLIQTTPKLPMELDWVEVKNIPWKDGSVILKHTGIQSTTIISEAKQAFTWRAVFFGNQKELWVNKKKVNAKKTTTFDGESQVYVDVVIPPGVTCTVSVKE